MNSFQCVALAAVTALAVARAPAQEVTRVYADTCAKCHGAKGAGGDKARSLLDDKLFGQEFDKRFFDAVKSGPPAEAGVKDHAYGADAGSFSDPQVWALVNYLRELQAADRRARVGK